MLTFKQFLNSQADDIEDMEAVRKYQEYKLEFRKTQIADFFTSHKDEEWYVFPEVSVFQLNMALLKISALMIILKKEYKICTMNLNDLCNIFHLHCVTNLYSVQE